MNAFILGNPEKCIGCKACEIACSVAHLDISVVKANEMNIPFISRLNLVRTSAATMPVQCRQCEDAPCANVCSVGAIVHKDNCNIVLEEKCIGCKECMLACPFGMLEMQPKSAQGEMEFQAGLKVESINGEQQKAYVVMQKCDLCTGRAEGPACIEVCPANAFVIVNSEFIRRNLNQKRISSAQEIAKCRYIRNS
ncbi:MAG: 4Fe-4S ferredoxin, iron-sulpur binding protein [Pelosinus sp.]|jgi:electron transport protein HydN|nr:4Fe-4S ferredoxin, iron-sulpur binding protein [Pelosinus sp.]